MNHVKKVDTTEKCLAQIENGKPVRIFIPLTGRPERIRAQCIYQEKSSPEFSLLFSPGILPVEEIDTTKAAVITVDMGGPAVSLEADIIHITDAQTLEMMAIKSINHEQMREFFRVDTVTDVISKSFTATVFESDNKEQAVTGKTVDISGNGILALFDRKPPQTKHIRLEITNPGPEKRIINVFARQVRMVELHDGRFEVAYHFDEISDDDRDSIICTCLTLQRQMLRLKVQVKGL